MWEQYRKTALATQVFIFLVCVLLICLAHVPLAGALIFFAAMQLGAVIGAWWAFRLKQKVLTRRDDLPLNSR